MVVLLMPKAMHQHVGGAAIWIICLGGVMVKAAPHVGGGGWGGGGAGFNG